MRYTSVAVRYLGPETRAGGTLSLTKKNRLYRRQALTVVFYLFLFLNLRLHIPAPGKSTLRGIQDAIGPGGLVVGHAVSVPSLAESTEVPCIILSSLRLTWDWRSLCASCAVADPKVRNPRLIYGSLSPWGYTS